METANAVVEALRQELCDDVVVLQVVGGGRLPQGLEYGVGVGVSRARPTQLSVGVACRRGGRVFLLYDTVKVVSPSDSGAVEEALGAARALAESYTVALLRGIGWAERVLQGDS